MVYQWYAKSWLEIKQVTDKKLLKHLDLLLKSSFPDSLDRQSVKENLLKKLETKDFVRLKLPNKTSLILTKDERKLKNLHRFSDSPFPLLSNIEFYSSSLSEWNTELLKYGIKARHKHKDLHSSAQSGIQVYLTNQDNLNTHSNRYLRDQYNRLKNYRTKKEILQYWKLAWKLMTKSWSFRLACLNSWSPTWYKSLPLKKVTKIIKGLHKILNLEDQMAEVKNVWIESPKDKWRQLGIPSQSWRLYLHMINMWITYLYDTHLPKSIYDGFMFNRGCKSWWETLLWGPLLTSYSSIIELDFSSGFPNISLHGVKKALESDGLIPSNLINLFLTHLNSTPHSASTFPTEETFIEHAENKSWKQSCRSVHMGLGISPILFVITLNWALIQEKVLSPNLTYKWYADDGSIYLNLKGLWEFFLSRKLPDKRNMIRSIFNNKNPVLETLDQSRLFKQVGLRICPKKSGWVRILGLWIKPYKSLGLTLLTSLNLLDQIKYRILNKPIPYKLKGSTRGRGANPVKNKPSTLPSNLELNFSEDNKRRLDYDQLIRKYKPYFGLLMSKLYNGNQVIPHQDQRLKSKTGSLLWKINPKKLNRTLLKEDRINLYNASSKMNYLFLTISSKTQIFNKSQSWINSKIERELTLDWEPISHCITKLSIKDSLTCPCWDKEDQSKEYFKKFGELKLSQEQKHNYRKLYNKQKRETIELK